MVLLDNGKFLTELHKLYEANKSKGTVWVTLKRSECSVERGAAPSLPTGLLPLLPCALSLRLLTPSPAHHDNERS